MMHLLAELASVVFLVAFVLGMAWLFEDLAPHELRDWSTEPIEDAEPTEGERP